MLKDKITERITTETAIFSIFLRVLLYGLLCPPIQICSEDPDKLTCILILLRMN